MLNLSLIFLTVAVVAAVLGFGGAMAGAGVAQVVFFAFFMLFIATLVLGLVARDEARTRFQT